ncbi:MAG: serine carboxypeptidase, partial [Caldilineaceae bacterium]|nr:serine carboxypeptidase [Caldilineaceae bacterium]
IGLPPKTVYACLGETALLAMDGRFEDYTLGRNIDMERVKEIWRLFKKHGFQLAGLRSFEEYITETDVVAKRKLAEALRRDPARFAREQQVAAAKLADIPIMAKGVRASNDGGKKRIALAAAIAVAAMLIGGRLRRTKRDA